MILALAAVLATLAAGDCRRDTSAQAPRTLMSAARLRALHVDEDGAVAPVNGNDGQLLELRLAASLCRFPGYTLAYVAGGTIGPNPTGYVIPESKGFQPDLALRTGGWELWRHWRDSSIFHPLVSLGVGRMRAEYRYRHRDSTGVWHPESIGPQRTTFAIAAAGVEARLFRYVTSYLVVGRRFSGDLDLPGLHRGSLGGNYLSFGFGFGKFR